MTFTAIRARLAAATLAAAACAAAPASAAIYITGTESGGVITFAFEGDFDAGGMTPLSVGNSDELAIPTSGALLFAGPMTGMLGYAMPSLPAFGTGPSRFGTATGDQFKIFSDDLVGFAAGYDGGFISGALTISSSFAEMGLIEGVYTSTAASGDFIELTISADAVDAPVPLPAAAPLMLAGLGGLLALRRKG